MPWWRKSVRGFSLYSEDLLNSKGNRWIIIITHLISFLLGITAIIIGGFSYAQSMAGGANFKYVNCSLAIDLNSSVNFPLKLVLVLTGVILIAVDLNLSVLFCLLKYCGCGGLVVLWYLFECLILTAWTAWSIFYTVTVFPLWQDDKDRCERFVLISAIVAVAVMTFFTLFYLAIIMIVVVYEIRERMGCRCYCCRRPKYSDDE